MDNETLERALRSLPSPTPSVELASRLERAIPASFVERAQVSAEPLPARSSWIAALRELFVSPLAPLGLAGAACAAALLFGQPANQGFQFALPDASLAERVEIVEPIIPRIEPVAPIGPSEILEAIWRPVLEDGQEPLNILHPSRAAIDAFRQSRELLDSQQSGHAVARISFSG